MTARSFDRDLAADLSAQDADQPEPRLGWALSPHGTVAVCKVLPDSGEVLLERRRAFSDEPRVRSRLDGLAPGTAVFPEDDGSVVVGDGMGRRIGTLTTDGVWVPWSAPTPRGARLFRGPGGSVDAYRSDAAGTVITRHRPHSVEELARLPHRALGGHALGESGLVVNVIGASGYAEALRIELSSGQVESFFTVSECSDDRVVGVARGTVIVTTTASGESRLGWGTLQDNVIRFPEAGSADRAMMLAALSADGARAVFVEDRGLTMALRLVDLHSETWRELGRPRLVLAGPGVIDDDRLVMPVGDQAHPGTLLEVRLDAAANLRRDDRPAPSAPRTTVADVPGPGGPIETLVVGDVVTARHVVVALHGGPFAAWRSAYHPLFNALAAEGVAVVAPNIRGSLGYGRAHAHAIRDRWGDVDAADVRAVCHWLAGRRDPKAMPPVLVGESYGAYLAVLVAASSAPGTVSGCAALSGFTSGARVAGLGSAVSQLVLRFGGHTCPDLLALAAAVPVPVLLLHGDLDEVVPVRESVDLAAALAAGGVPVRLVRDQVGGHDLMASPNGRQHRRRLLSFVLDPGTARHTNAHREGVNT